MMDEIKTVIKAAIINNRILSHLVRLAHHEELLLIMLESADVPAAVMTTLLVSTNKMVCWLLVPFVSTTVIFI